MMQQVAARCCICYTLAMRLTVTLSPEVIKLLKSAAKAERRSVSSYVARLLERWAAKQAAPEPSGLGRVVQAMHENRQEVKRREEQAKTPKWKNQYASEEENRAALDEILVPKSEDDMVQDL